MKTLHFFTEYYAPDSSSTSFFLTRITEAAAKGFHGPVSVVCAIAAAPEGERAEAERIRITRIPPPKLNKNRLPGRIVKLLWISVCFTWHALFHVKRGDIVYTLTEPAFWPVMLALLHRVKKFHFVLLVHDIFPEVLLPAKLSCPDSAAYRFTLRAFDWAYCQVDEFIVIGRDMQKVCERKAPRGRFHLIENWCDIAYIKPLPKTENTLLKQLKIENKCVFTLMGNLGRTHGIENLLQAVSLVKSPRAAFVIIGSGAEGETIRQYVRNHPSSPIHMLGYVSGMDQAMLQAACDVAVITLGKGMFGLSVPSKSYFNMAAGRPLLLIADAETEIGLVIQEEHNGWEVPPENPALLAARIDEICECPPEELSAMGERSRRAAEKRFSAETILDRYERFFAGMNEKE